jgi:tRNA nucleotidyltransferase (CCA-adding enzyme)
MVDQLKKLSPDFKKILKASSTLAYKMDCKIYLVGGVVRDLILGRKVFDLDIVVEKDAIAFARTLADCLKTEFNKHHAFGTATVCYNGHKIDFATARVEKYSHWGALPKVMPATLASDLFRRDFTINAMAISLNKNDYGKIIDLYNGLHDLRKGVLRILHQKSFLDDPTRILRAIRFEQRFGFKIEEHTFSLMKEAIAANALKFVNPHRLRDEIILILKENKPYRYIKRIKELKSFYFLDSKLNLNKRAFRLFLRLEQTISYYQRKFRKHRVLEEWLMYLAGILIKLPGEKVCNILHDFGFKKGERSIVNSIKKGIFRIKWLDKPTKPHFIYQVLNPYSYEAILFFYAYHTQKRLRKNIECFLQTLVDIRLKIRGEDLKNLEFKPFTLYSKLLDRLLYAKIDKGFKNKEQEIKEAKNIFKQMVKQ